VLVRAFAEGDPARMLGIRARFSKHVVPGETVVVEAWAPESSVGGSGSGSGSGSGRVRVLFQCRVAERGNEIVLSNGVAEFLAGDGAGVSARL
jgi:hypothetical protein